MDVPAAKFKAECLKLMDLVEKTCEPIIITKRISPVAQVCTGAGREELSFGYMRDTLKIRGDVVAPIAEEWERVIGRRRSSLYKGTWQAGSEK